MTTVLDLKNNYRYHVYWLSILGLFKENLSVMLSQHSKSKPTTPVPVKFMEPLSSLHTSSWEHTKSSPRALNLRIFLRVGKWTAWCCVKTAVSKSSPLCVYIVLRFLIGLEIEFLNQFLMLSQVKAIQQRKETVFFLFLTIQKTNFQTK